MKKINLLCVIILALLLGCQKKNDCYHIDMSHYIKNIQKIHSKMDKGFFVNEKFNNDCCCYEVALPISCNEEPDSNIFVISPFIQNGFFYFNNNILFFIYEYKNELDTVAFFDFTLKKGESRSVLFANGNFICNRDSLIQKEALITMDTVFFSEKFEDVIYKFRIDYYLMQNEFSYNAFVSKKIGIVGNYYSFHKENIYSKNFIPEGFIESIVRNSMQGDMFEDIVDYSNVRYVSIM